MQLFFVLILWLIKQVSYESLTNRFPLEISLGLLNLIIDVKWELCFFVTS
jgi:hypothetical protein